MAEGVLSRERAEELSPGIVSIDGKEEKMPKAKKIAALPLDVRRKLLETAAKRAAHEYETDRELTAFTELDGAVNDYPRRRLAGEPRSDDWTGDQED
ncbi:MAG: hypothetical protein ACREDU_11265 [Methylocella sp.]